MEFVLRFVLGGVLVSVFAAIGSAFKPKTFAGLFGAAPPVALASLGWAYYADGHAQVALLARSMLIGSAGLLTYAFACALLVRTRKVSVLPITLLAWLTWFASTGAVLKLTGLR